MKFAPLLEVAPLSKSRATRWEGQRLYVATGDVDDMDNFAPSTIDFDSKPSRADLTAAAGDVVFARMAATSKVFEVTAERSEFVYSTGFAILRPRDGILDSTYLRHWLRTPEFQRAKDAYSAGATQRAITNGGLAKMVVPLPALDQQERIAAILSKADALRAKRRQVLAHLDALTSAIFHDMFGEAIEYRPFAETCRRVTVGVVIRPASYYVATGVPALRTLNVRPGRLDLRDLVYFSEESNSGSLAKSRLSAGDLVIARTGKPGTTAIVPPELDGANAIDLIVATPDPDVADPVYLESVLNSDVGKRIVLGESRGQIQQHFNVGSLKSASVPIPPLARQREFATKIEELNGQRIVVHQAIAADEELFRSLQARAFRGEL